MCTWAYAGRQGTNCRILCYAECKVLVRIRSLKMKNKKPVTLTECTTFAKSLKSFASFCVAANVHLNE